MKMRWFAVGLLLAGLAVYVLRDNALAAQEPVVVLIQNRQFVPSQLQIVAGEQVRFVNTDDAAYEFRIRKQGLTGAYKGKSKSFSPATSATGTTYTTSFGVDDVGNYEYVITDEPLVVGNLVVVAGAGSVSPIATASASASPLSSPTVSFVPSPIVQVSPSASVVASPSVPSSPSPTGSASPVPSVSPTFREDLPGFSLLRKTSCSAEVVGSFVLTERLSSARLVRGYWEITSLVQNQQGVRVGVLLDKVRVLNLFFRGSRFFRGDVTYNNLGEVAVFEGGDLDQVLGKAAGAWCKRAMFY